MENSPLALSLRIAFLSCIINLMLALPAAWSAGRLSVRTGAFVDALLTLPLVLPPTVTGFFLLMLFGKNSPIGAALSDIGLRLIFTWQGALLASCVVSFPLMFRTAEAAFEQINPDILDAARTLGLSEPAIFCRLMLPLALPGIGAGIVLTFARALGEFGATVMVAGNIPGKTQTLSLLIYTATAAGDTRTAFYWVAVLAAISLLSTGLMNLWLLRHSKIRQEGDD